MARCGTRVGQWGDSHMYADREGRVAAIPVVDGVARDGYRDWGGGFIIYEDGTICECGFSSGESWCHETTIDRLRERLRKAYNTGDVLLYLTIIRERLPQLFEKLKDVYEELRERCLRPGPSLYDCWYVPPS